MKQFHFLFLLLFISFISLPAQSLKNTKWVLVSIDNLETSKAKLIETLVTSALYFNEDTTYSGNACNFFTGSYTTSAPNTIRMTYAGGTKKFCLKVSDLEKEIISHYANATRYKQENNNLFIFTSDNYRLTLKKE